MNNPSPFAPKSSLPEPKNASRAKVRMAVFCILSVHVVGLMALLMIGCRKPQTEEVAPPPPDTTMITPDLETPTNIDTTVPTNDYTAAPVEPATNTYTPPVEPVVAPVMPASQQYTVIAGDTLSKIAGKFPGVTVKQIQEANPTVVPTRLRIGQKLEIPAPSVTAPTAPSGMAVESGSEQIYTVKSGDNLTTIASRHGTTVKALRAENNLTTDRIKVGQKLKIPAKVPAATEAAPITNP